MNSSNDRHYSANEISIALRSPVLFTVLEHFAIPGRGSVLFGRIDSGIIKIGTKLCPRSTPTMTLEVDAIELNRKLREEVYFCELVGLMFLDRDLSSIKKGEVLMGD